LKGGVTFAQGIAGQAFRLDGATRHLEMPHSDLWGFGRQDFSIELWVQWRALRPSNDIGYPSAVFIGCDEGNGPGRGKKWFFAYGGGFLNFHINHANGKYGFYAKAEFSPDVDEWYHLAVTRSGGTFTIYVNGAPVASEKVDILIPNPDAPLTIGQAENLGFFSGLIDEVAIYDRALSPAEVKARWSALAPAAKAVAEKVGDEVRRYEGHTEMIFSGSFSPDGRRALTGSKDGTARLWDIATGKELRCFVHPNRVEGVSFSHDGRRAVSGCEDGAVRLWDLETGKEIRRFNGHTEIVVGVVFSPDDRRILSGSHDGTLRLWDAQTAEEIRRFKGSANGVSYVALSPDGRRALSGGGDQTVRLWDVDSGREIRKFEGHTGWVRWVDFAPDGRTAVSASYDKTARLWDVETGKEVRQLVGHTDIVQCAAFSPDGRRILTASRDKTIRLWDTSTGHEVHIFKADYRKDGVLCASFSPDGRFALSVGEDAIGRLWRLPDLPAAKENP
jgi:tricorn protease-like protein